MKLLPPIYVINLTKDKERWANILKQSDAARITPVRVDATMGKEMTWQERDDLATTTCRDYCTPSLLGVASSHILAWEAFLNGPETHAIVMEDDAEFGADFKKQFLTKIRDVPSDFDFTFLGCSGACEYDDGVAWAWHDSMQVFAGGKRETVRITENVFVPKYPTAFHAYCLSRKCAEFLLQKMKGQVAYHIDLMFVSYLRELKVYAMNPNIVNQRTTTELSGNLTNKFPHILNKMVSPITDKNYTLDYIMTISTYDAYGVPINIWLFLWILMAITSSTIASNTMFSGLMFFLVFETMINWKNYKSIVAFLGILLIVWTPRIISR